MGSIKRKINDLIATVYPKKEYVKIDGSVIASPDRRYCGKEFNYRGFILSFLATEKKLR